MGLIKLIIKLLVLPLLVQRCEGLQPGGGLRGLRVWGLGRRRAAVQGD